MDVLEVLEVEVVGTEVGGPEVGGPEVVRRLNQLRGEQQQMAAKIESGPEVDSRSSVADV